MAFTDRGWFIYARAYFRFLNRDVVQKAYEGFFLGYASKSPLGAWECVDGVMMVLRRIARKLGDGSTLWYPAFHPLEDPFRYLTPRRHRLPRGKPYVRPYADILARDDAADEGWVDPSIVPEDDRHDDGSARQ